MVVARPAHPADAAPHLQHLRSHLQPATPLQLLPTGIYPLDRVWQQHIAPASVLSLQLVVGLGLPLFPVPPGEMVSLVRDKSALKVRNRYQHGPHRHGWPRGQFALRQLVGLGKANFCVGAVAHQEGRLEAVVL
jgi:hypothetical protein